MKIKTEPITLALVGAGNRGVGVFGRYALDNPHKARFVAVVEPDTGRRNAFAAAHRIPESSRFEDMETFFSSSRRHADGLVLATLETKRIEPIACAMAACYAILAEKPLATTLEETIRIVDMARNYDGLFMVCHQLRYTPFYGTIQRLIESKKFGDVLCLQHSENLEYGHMAHSFVRGLWNSSKISPMILAKACHDMDIMPYLMGRKPVSVASFGGLVHFRPENAPAGAPAHCMDGCPAENECPYHAGKLYLRGDVDPAYLRHMDIAGDQRDILECLKTNRFGRCVFRCDNDVVDQQVVSISFEGGTTASFTMCGHNATERRITKLSMSGGEIEADLSSDYINTFDFTSRERGTIRPAKTVGSHLGADQRIMDDFTDAIATGRREVLTPATGSLTSHLLAFAAEESRLSHQTIDLDAFEARCRKEMRDGEAGIVAHAYDAE